MLHKRLITKALSSNLIPKKHFKRLTPTLASPSSRVRFFTSHTVVTPSPTIPTGGVLAPNTDGLDPMHHVEYHLPPTFLAEHETIMGGHVPGSMWHINLIQDFLEGIHDVLGVHWWAAISIGTIAFRLAVLPLNIGLIRNSARLSSMRDELVEQGEKLKDPAVPYDDKLEAAQKVDKMLKDNKCHPLLNIASPIVMFPMFLSLFLAVERICLHDPRAATEGMLWFTNLGLVDPTWVMPVLSGLTWLITVELGAAPPQTEVMKQVKRVLFFLVTVMVPVSGALPSGVFVYWLTSNMFSVCQILLLRRPGVRKFLRIPATPANKTAGPTITL